MIDSETAETALGGIQNSIIALVEESHPGLVEAQPEDLAERALRFSAMVRFGKDITTLAEAAAIILRRSDIM